MTRDFNLYMVDFMLLYPQRFGGDSKESRLWYNKATTKFKGKCFPHYSVELFKYKGCDN